MRDNGMTTGRVIELRDGQIIVSRADEAGRIVFANQDFVEISGFSEAALLDQFEAGFGGVVCDMRVHIL